MKNYITLTLTISLFLLGAFSTYGQEKEIAPDLAKITDSKIWRVSNATAETVVMDGKRVAHLKAKGDSATRIAGLALPVGVEFATGVIELDLKGKNVPQGSFLGIVFNVVDEKTFEGIYFRPFNFTADKPAQDRAVQYIAWPENTWEKLRKDKPGQFENAVNPAPDPGGWFHARIEVADKQVQVFVNDSKAPCLTVNRLAEGRMSRPVGLFVDVAEGLYANLKVTPSKSK